jgi:surface carbohydrate biosynthesis protein
MTAQSIAFIVPVENQVRELDAKLLVACAAAERGFRVFLGSRTRIDFRIATFPRSIYLSKGMTPKSAKMFRIMRKLGHEIAAMDEEGLVYHSADEYYARRVSAATFKEITSLLAWGDAGAELLRKHPDYRSTPIHVTGNPRIDLMRPELQPYFEDEANRIREQLGHFVLINTNFSKVNAYFPKMNLLAPPARPGQPPELGAAGIGLTREFAEGLAAHKRAIFDHFREMIPVLHEAFPDHQIVVRPHPSENREPWKLLAKDLGRVHVIHEGNVIPWLAASRALIHNGCTTGIEAFIMQKPALAYRPVSAGRFDLNSASSAQASTSCTSACTGCCSRTPAAATATRSAS